MGALLRPPPTVHHQETTTNRRTLIAATAAGVALSGATVVRAAPPSREIMGLGWYVVFSPPSRMDQGTSFYGATLGLPVMMTMRTPQQNKNYFWCGEDIVLDLSHHAPEGPFDPRDADPATARQIPIFRTNNLGALMATFTWPTSPSTSHPRPMCALRRWRTRRRRSAPVTG